METLDSTLSVTLTEFFPYSVLHDKMLGYCGSPADLSVFQTGCLPFGLACSKMLSEVGLFLIAMCFFTLAFGCALNCLHQELDEFHGPPAAFLVLTKVFLRMISADKFDEFQG